MAVLKINGKQVNPTSLNNWFIVCKKPVEVKAVRIGEAFEVETLNGMVKCEAGEYLIRGVEGEFYPCKASIFDKTYQVARELTKGVNIPCRDCGELLSILTTETANIIDARCPKCYKEFQKKAKEYNLEIGYTRSGEALSPLAASSLADSGSFGLEKWLLGIRDEKAKELLRDGVAFCDYVLNKQEDSITNDIARNVRSRIKTIIDEDVAMSEKEARAMQAFFNSESAPMLKSALTQQRSQGRRRNSR